MRIPVHPVLLALPALVVHLAGAQASNGPDGSAGDGLSAVSLSEAEYPTWNLPDGATARLGKGRVSPSDRAVAFSPDGRSLAVATVIGVWLYDLEDRSRLTLLPVERAQAVAYATDGTTLVVGSQGGIELWDVASGTRTAALGGVAWIEAMALSPDGGTLATGTGGSPIELWDLATGSLLAATLDGQTSEVTSVSFSPGGTVLVAGEMDGSVRLWDLTTGASTVTFRHWEEIRSVSFSPDGTTVASASRDGTVQLWDVETGTQALTLELRMRGREDLGVKLQVFSVSYSPDPAILASGGPLGTVQVWDLAKAKIRTFYGQGGFVESVAFSPDGRTLASATEGSVFLWDLTTGDATALSEHMEVIPGLAFSPDGSTLATTAYAWDASIDLWDVATGRRTATLTGASRDRVLAFSPNGRTLAQGVYGGEVRLLDVATGTVIGRLGPMRTIQSPDHVTDVTSLAFSPDGGTLAAGTDEDVIYLWDLESQTRIRTLLGDVDRISFGPDGHRTIPVTSLLFSPDGRTLASGSSRGTVRLWDLATGTPTAAPASGHEHGVQALSFSPDGAVLASGSSNRANLWDVERGATMRMLQWDWAQGVDLSPDGTLLAAGQNGRVRLWEVTTGRPLATVEGHGHIVSRVVFSPDGRVLASSSQDGTILLWDVPSILPNPRALTVIGGEEQEGRLNSALGRPFVVEVRDQHGALLEGAEVIFAVTAGGGTLSAAVDTTDAQGRAAATLTLGRDPGDERGRGHRGRAGAGDLHRRRHGHARLRPGRRGGLQRLLPLRRGLRRQRSPFRPGRQRPGGLRRLLPLLRALRPAGAGQAAGHGRGADRAARGTRPAAERAQPLQQRDGDPVVPATAGGSAPGGLRPDGPSGWRCCTRGRGRPGCTACAGMAGTTRDGRWPAASTCTACSRPRGRRPASSPCCGSAPIAAPGLVPRRGRGTGRLGRAADLPLLRQRRRAGRGSG